MAAATAARITVILDAVSTARFGAVAPRIEACATVGSFGIPFVFVRQSRAESYYDTASYGLSNGGHLYGDALTASERTAVLAYLKTL